MSEERSQLINSKTALNLFNKSTTELKDNFQAIRHKLLRKTTTMELNFKIPTIDQENDLKLRKISSMHFDEIEEE